MTTYRLVFSGVQFSSGRGKRSNTLYDDDDVITITHAVRFEIFPYGRTPDATLRAAAVTWVLILPTPPVTGANSNRRCVGHHRHQTKQQKKKNKKNNADGRETPKSAVHQARTTIMYTRSVHVVPELSSLQTDKLDYRKRYWIQLKHKWASIFTNKPEMFIAV